MCSIILAVILICMSCSLGGGDRGRGRGLETVRRVCSSVMMVGSRRVGVSSVGNLIELVVDGRLCVETGMFGRLVSFASCYGAMVMGQDTVSVRHRASVGGVLVSCCGR